MSVHAALITVEEYLKLPEPKEGHTELHHGEVVIMPPVKRGHQRRQRRILALLTQVLSEKGVAETETAFRPTPEHEVWQADVAYISFEREAAAGEYEYLTGAPELVVEVLSPSNTVDEIEDKRAICMANGCISFWVVDSKRQQVSVTEGNITTHFGISDSISCALFSDRIPVREIFA